jgi:hypothetical protein
MSGEAIHEPKYVCALCDDTPAAIGNHYIPLCLRCRTKSLIGPKPEPFEMPVGRALTPVEIVARDAMLAANRGS